MNFIEILKNLKNLSRNASSDVQAHYCQRIELVIQAGGDSFDALTRLASDAKESNDVRSAACLLLGRLRSKRAIPAVLQAFKSDDLDLGWQATMALAEINHKWALKPLEIAARSHPEANRRLAAVYALGFLKDTRAVGILLDVLNDEQEEPLVRGEAAEALSYKRREDRILETLLQRLQDPVVDVQFWCAFALAHQGGSDPRAISALEELASRSTDILPGWWEASKEAQWALKVLTDPDTEHEFFEQLIENRHRTTPLGVDSPPAQ